jgi:hypothetical protein
MSTAQWQALALRKQRLQMRSAGLRRTLAAQVNTTFGPALTVVDHVQAGGRWALAHPALLAGGAALLLAWRPKRGLVWAQRGWWLWQTWRQLQPMLTKSLPKP